MKMEAETIITESLTKFYGKIRGIEDITVRIPSGGVGFLGPNGAGKTTFIRTLLGIIRPTRGRAQVLGYDIRHEINQVRDRIGYIPEFNTSFIPDTTAMKFVAFCARMNGLSYAESKQRASDSLFYVGLGEERYRKLATFSLGMKQKVKLAVALVHDPEIIICDEPTNGLDPTGRVQMLELIRSLQTDEGKNVILSSHLLRDVEQTTDYAMVISEGKIRAEGNIKELTANRRSTVSVKVKTKTEELLHALEKRGMEVWIEGAFIEVKTNPDVEKEIFKTAFQIGADIRYIGSRSSTLEDVFVSLFKEQEAPIQ
ncbi:MAG: ABC transporter ATP-binding protein [Candidatus Heimdallarchaeota archaeon]|nr:MAG: ABC transporter ATP-binding protein [Candidatus Heimdallarchaeota archaeon]